MKYFTQEALMNELCKHCDSHIEMCDGCPMKEMIKEIPTTWIACNDRLPEESRNYLVWCKTGYVSNLMFSAKHQAWNVLDHSDRLDTAIEVTHWMPLPDAPVVEDEQ